MAALNLYILTFNCAQAFIDTDAFASQLFLGLTSSQLPDILILSLQEIAPIPHSFVGGSFLVPYFEKFYHAVQRAARKASNASDGPVYAPIAARNLGMAGIMAFAKDPSCIQDLETGGVGVGLWDMGNKAGVGLRFTYQGNGGSAELTFVAAHLAAMEDQLERRNEDWKNIVRRLVFSSMSKKTGTSLSAPSEERPLLSISPQDASIYKPTSHLFVAGDLNYRTSILSPSPIDHIETFPQPHDDPSSPNHFTALFQHDQLTQERLAGRTCHGLVESQVTFPPTYKYDPKEPILTPDEDIKKWEWAKHRWPSWCDRILYLDVPEWLHKDKPELKIVPHKYIALPSFPTSDHRAVAEEFTVPLTPIPKPVEDDECDDPRIHLPFDIDVDWKTRREKARILELVVGFTLYFTTTWEGVGVFGAMIAGGVGAWFVLKALLM